MAVSFFESKGRQASSWRPFGVRLGLVLACVSIAACSWMGGGRTADPKPQRDLLLREEIVNSNARQGDLLQAIRSLRPEFLAPPRSRTTRRGAPVAPITVYIEGVRQSGIEALRNMAASSAVEVRYLDPTASASVYGPTAGGGAIVVKVFGPRTPDGP